MATRSGARASEFRVMKELYKMFTCRNGTLPQYREMAPDHERIFIFGSPTPPGLPLSLKLLGGKFSCLDRARKANEKYPTVRFSAGCYAVCNCRYFFDNFDCIHSIIIRTEFDSFRFPAEVIRVGVSVPGNFTNHPGQAYRIV